MHTISGSMGSKGIPVTRTLPISGKRQRRYQLLTQYPDTLIEAVSQRRLGLCRINTSRLNLDYSHSEVLLSLKVRCDSIAVVPWLVSDRR